MLLMQAVVFSPPIQANQTRWLIAPGLLAFMAGLLFVPWAADFWRMLAVIGAVAASAGIVSPILIYWISATAGNAQGWALGRQAAAASLGMTVGSAAGGLLFTVGRLPGASFVLTAGLVGVGALLSFRLPHVLAQARSVPE